MTRIGATLKKQSLSLAVAESLTGGHLAATFAAAPEAADWFRGGIVAYNTEVKHSLLQTPAGPVVTAETAKGMAASVLEILGADAAIAVTGVGGPGPEEGKPAGTVFIATCIKGAEPNCQLHLFEGDPLSIINQTIEASISALVTLLL